MTATMAAMIRCAGLISWSPPALAAGGVDGGLPEGVLGVQDGS